MSGAAGSSDTEAKAAMGSSQRMEAAGTRATRWAIREVKWSFWEKRHRRQSREGSGERAGTRTSFKWAGAHESIGKGASFKSVVQSQREQDVRGRRWVDGKPERVSDREIVT
jgi:hypothetical protein